MLTIGEFSRICFVTKKTLRHYDEIGLLRPEHIADNGYRYYTVDQLQTMRLICRLKTYEFSLPEIAAVLANPDKESLAECLLEKQKQMEAALEKTNRTLTQLKQDVEKLKRRMDIMNEKIVVQTVELAPVKLYSMRKTMNVQEIGQGFDQLCREAEKKHLHMVGAPKVFYWGEGFSHDEDNDMELAIPVSDDLPGLREQPGGLHCYTSFVGPYVQESFMAAYAGLAKWIEDNGYRVCGLPFDNYVRGGMGVPPSEFVTEVYFPIEK